MERLRARVYLAFGNLAKISPPPRSDGTPCSPSMPLKLRSRLGI